MGIVVRSAVVGAAVIVATLVADGVGWLVGVKDITVGVSSVATIEAVMDAAWAGVVAITVGVAVGMNSSGRAVGLGVGVAVGVAPTGTPM